MTTPPDPNAALRSLPSVDALLTGDDGGALIARYGRSAAAQAMRDCLADVRERLRRGDAPPTSAEALLIEIARDLERRFQPSLRPVINAAGIILHTNLGRAPLSAAAQEAMVAVAAAYSTLEYDLAAGARGSRLIHPESVLREVTGAEAALVVNNNAAALVLILSALAKERDVIISRGQLVEIGGGFRVPDVMIQSGARLVEVGTTNRTRAADYAAAITPETALLMRAHASNFRQIGFVESAALEDLAALARSRDVLLVDDLGSGALIDTTRYGLEHEPTVQESLAAGCDLVAFSGDKLLGGPQAGIIVGRRTLIERLKKHPLARAIRADKLCLAALVATLDHYRRDEAPAQIPIWRMIARPLTDLQTAAASWAAALREHAAVRQIDLSIEVIEGESAVGGGSLPGVTLPTALLALRLRDPSPAAAALRAGDPPVIARIKDDRLLFDPRTVLPSQDAALLAALRAVLH
ncbi:MAG: L-seryl-tRNA(Sec) selenium transferase [Anaerolineae bacterium]|nr:L-seryl-tRNA(Sec) selenium transferase [Anaerolineae bacterium]NUQ07342.1 L-seryl-tRNA(Sec) selenium transferase [Anaerolineae bacterium]